MSGSTNQSRHDGDLLFLTDTAYFALLDHESGHRSPKGKNRQDGLFLERLDSFLEAQQKDIESFANREQRSLEEIRKLVAIPHLRYIFSLDPTLPPSDLDVYETSRQADCSVPSIRSTLARISSTLQSLHSAAGLDSLLVVVSPHFASPPPASSTPTTTDSGDSHAHPMNEASWIGGTELGKEFWMGLKGGGLNGARAFRVMCQLRREAELQVPDFHATASTTATIHVNSMRTADSVGVRTTKIRSRDVKTELNAAVRQALRSTSGNPSAEMRWTKPASLEESYDVRLVGWPPTVNMRNPSNNSLKDNRILLDLVRSGKMKFVKRGSTEWSDSGSGTGDAPLDGNPLTLVSGHSGHASSHSPMAHSPMLSISYAQPLQTLPQPSQSPFTSTSSLRYPNPSLIMVSTGDVRDDSFSPPGTPLQSPLDSLSASDMTGTKRHTEEQMQTRQACEVKRAKFDSRGETR